MAVGAPALAAGPAAPPMGGRRRRGPAAPTVNPRTIADFEDITGIPFAFARHPMHHEAHIHMNTTHSDAFMDMGDLFTVTAPPTRTTAVLSAVMGTLVSMDGVLGIVTYSRSQYVYYLLPILRSGFFTALFLLQWVPQFWVLPGG